MIVWQQAMCMCMLANVRTQLRLCLPHYRPARQPAPMICLRTVTAALVPFQHQQGQSIGPEVASKMQVSITIPPSQSINIIISISMPLRVRCHMGPGLLMPPHLPLLFLLLVPPLRPLRPLLPLLAIIRQRIMRLFLPTAPTTFVRFIACQCQY